MIVTFWHFFTAWVRVQWAQSRGYRTIAPGPVQDRREALCATCDFFNEGVCSACGCLVLSKTMLATEKCPKGRWNRVWIKRPPEN